MKNEPFRILLADDDQADCLIFKKAFDELKIVSEVSIVNGGPELIELLAESEKTLPHILFLDLNMPVKNGLTCLKEIRGNKLYDKISIVIYSTSSMEKDVEDTFYNGANVYLQKPNDFNTLKESLKRVVFTAYNYKDTSFNLDNFLLKL